MAQSSSDSASFLQKATELRNEWRHVPSDDAALCKIVARNLTRAVAGGTAGLAAVVATVDAAAVARELDQTGVRRYFTQHEHERGAARRRLQELDRALGEALAPLNVRPHAREGDGFAAALLTQQLFFPNGPSEDGFAAFTKALAVVPPPGIVPRADADRIGGTKVQAAGAQFRT